MNNIKTNSLVFLICLLSFAVKAQKNFIDHNYINVIGKAEMKISPDEIYIGILINEKDKKGKVSIEEQESKMIDGFNSLGINTAEKLKIKDFNSNYYNRFWKKNDVLKKKQYELLLHDTNILQKVFSLLERLQISNASIIRIDHSQMIDLKEKIKIEAIRAAKKKAVYLSSAIDQTVGKALFIKEVPSYNSSITNNSNAVYRESALYGNSQNIITGNYNQPEFKNITINAIVEVNFELK
ncbi:DUF541 domain-containing protein [Leptobacterium flavescens]|uniref:DUF541 domain-containing protein n=1 Tax=Leptobacterium flavescens TaxID=472055 RepID=A0A6P0UHB1_9FLAO|nr:SIMPL domain-containing protein [Leptobacterium flavescens]NER12634.1 DUF541 domain-containing protein [Leptobacterium flavescens]